MWLRSFFVFSIFFLLECSPVPDQYGGYNSSQVGGNVSNDNLRQTVHCGEKDLVEATVDARYDGGFVFEGEDPTLCKESSECVALCEDWYFERTGKSRCEKSSASAVRAVDSTLILIKRSRFGDLNESIVTAILDINPRIIEDLINGYGRRDVASSPMNKGNLEGFLAWIASSTQVSKALEEHDRGNRILTAAFSRLGSYIDKKEVDNNYIRGLNATLETDKSFFAIAMAGSQRQSSGECNTGFPEPNEVGFKLAYDVLINNTGCNDTWCKLQILCASTGTESTTDYYSNYSFLDEQDSCKNTRVGSSKVSNNRKGCYIHGEVVWDFINRQIEDSHINDIDTKTCDDHCGKGGCPSI